MYSSRKYVLSTEFFQESIWLDSKLCRHTLDCPSPLNGDNECVLRQNPSGGELENVHEVVVWYEYNYLSFDLPYITKHPQNGIS